MYISIPDVFFVPVYYAEEDILNIEKIIILQEYNFYSNFTNKTTKRKQLVIGVSLPTQREARWVKDKKAMEAYAKEKGITLKIEISDFDAAKQASQIENLITQGVNVLILVPIDVLGLADLVEKAHKARIKVISYDTLIKNSDLDLYASFNNIRVGELQGRFLIEKVPKGNYIIMYGDPDIGIKEGAMEYIQPLANIGNIKIVVDKGIKGWDPSIAFNIVKDALVANKNKINAILAPNDAIAGAAIEALKAQGLPSAVIEELQEKGLVGAAIQGQGLAGKVAVTGQDADLAAIRRIIQGTQSMTVFKDTRELAKNSIDAAIKLANGETININKKVNNGKVDVPSIFISPIVIDKDNIESVLIGSGYYTKEEVYTR